jgi:L-idonate 5-dehydrogenase
MQACVLHGAHDLRLEQQDDPALAPDEVRIRVRNGGICGSDLHYFHAGRIGDFLIREPLVPGHEFSGEVAEVGRAVTRVRIGDRVAVHPGRSCGRCVRCREGRSNLCQNVFFMGSASKFPHMQGGFRERVCVRESQCYPVTSDIGFDELAFAEPLAVALHAGTRAGNLLGRKVLVTGGGPIGQLLLLVAQHGGASHVALTDIVDAPLDTARRIGADDALNVKSEPESLNDAATRIGGYDVAFEASGTAAGLNAAIDAVHPGGTIVQVGSLPAGPSPLTANRIMAKELALLGSFRFDAMFATSVGCLETRRIDVRPLLTGVMPMQQACAAFELAGDRARSIKVQIAF